MKRLFTCTSAAAVLLAAVLPSTAMPAAATAPRAVRSVATPTGYWRLTKTIQVNYFHNTVPAVVTADCVPTSPDYPKAYCYGVSGTEGQMTTKSGFIGDGGTQAAPWLWINYNSSWTRPPSVAKPGAAWHTTIANQISSEVAGGFPYGRDYYAYYVFDLAWVGKGATSGWTYPGSGMGTSTLTGSGPTQGTATATLKFPQFSTNQKTAAGYQVRLEFETPAFSYFYFYTWTSTTTITCMKGKKVVKVTAHAPKCPAGYLKATTITCVRGSKTLKVTAVRPSCPRGYKKK